MAGSIQTLTRIKRKVRLAARLNSENALLMKQWSAVGDVCACSLNVCGDIPPSQIRVVATAHYALPSMRGDFIAKAQENPGCPVQAISGEEEYV
ncbi:hypothetical protein ACLK17_23520 [Escherichia coli]